MSDLLPWLCRLLGATAARRGASLQTLWGGYGEILRVQLEGAAAPSVIVKRVEPPVHPSHHPRGWTSPRSHARKLRSYQVEWAWYRDHAARCQEVARLPAYLGGRRQGSGWELVLEDLDPAGFPGRRRRASRDELDRCLEWLARFHARFLREPPGELWPTGTYWHLGTRPDELAALEDAALRAAAPALDARLEGARHRTLVHGDAKLANFCFAPAGPGVAAVDFQYVGGGCGMKDVAYLLSSALDERGLEAHAEGHVDRYFRALRRALAALPEPPDGAALEAEWRALTPFAWADLCRFLGGWAPGHGKLHGYSAARTREALGVLARENPAGQGPTGSDEAGASSSPSK